MSARIDVDDAHSELAGQPGSTRGAAASRALAVLRICMGFVFLWAFLDKAFGWRYATVGQRAWIHGGSPTKGFLSAVDVGTFQGPAHSIAGSWWADWLFMAGLLGIGVALILGIGIRIAAACGTAMMALMWLAEFPPAQHTSTGAPTGSSNPLVDYHFLYAVVLLVLATTHAGHVWGAGARWARTPFVARNRWAL